MNEAQLDQPDPQDQLVPPVTEAKPELPVNKDHVVNPELLDRLAAMADLDHQDPEEKSDHPDHLVNPDHLDPLDHLDRQDNEENLVPQDKGERPVHPDLPDLLDSAVRLDLQDNRDLMEGQDPQVRRCPFYCNI